MLRKSTSSMHSERNGGKDERFHRRNNRIHDAVCNRVHDDSDRSVDMAQVTLKEASSVEEMLEQVSDGIRGIAHSIAMLKKGVTLQTEVTPEDFDKALAKQCEKEWNEVKDLNLEQYMWRGFGEMLMSGVDPERIFGEEDGKEDC